MKRFIQFCAAVVGLASIVACGATAAVAMDTPQKPNADAADALATAKLAAEAQRQTGMPAVRHFTEKKAVKWLYELRDEPNFRTFTYIVSLDGELIQLCNSVGYGVPASVQYSNPVKVIDKGDHHGNGYGYLPQPEPNGLFMPEGLAATWVMCVDELGDDVKAVYVEPEIIVSPIQLIP